MEIESALVAHTELVAEAAVVGRPDETTGEAICAFVVLRFGDNLPRTRSGKIMRRLLRSVATSEKITQDTSTLENPAILEQLAQAN